MASFPNCGSQYSRQTHTAANQLHRHNPNHQFLLYSTLLSFDLQRPAFSRVIQHSPFQYIPSLNLPSNSIFKYPYQHYRENIFLSLIPTANDRVPKFRSCNLTRICHVKPSHSTCRTWIIFACKADAHKRNTFYFSQLIIRIISGQPSTDAVDMFSLPIQSLASLLWILSLADRSPFASVTTLPMPLIPPPTSQSSNSISTDLHSRSRRPTGRVSKVFTSPILLIRCLLLSFLHSRNSWLNGGVVV